MNRNPLEIENEALKKRNSLYEEILDKVIQAIYVIDKNENVVWLNNQIALLDRLDRNKLIGQKDSAISLWKINNRKDCDLLYTVKTGEPSPEKLTSWLNQSTGQMMHMWSQAYPFYYNDELEYIYSLGFYIEHTEKHLNKITELYKSISEKGTHFPNNTSYTLYDIVGSCLAIKNLVSMARKVAVNNSPIMLYGETGTGKEIFAQGIHNASLHNKGPFVAVNCAAIPENLLESTLFGSVKGAFTGAVTKAGLLEEAENGSLFLDELDSVPLSIQSKILRVLQERQASRIGDNTPYSFHCRIISATNREPRKLVEDGILRSDLYFRLAVINLEIPPLFKRENDIEELTLYFVSKFNKEYHLNVSLIDPQVFAIFHQYTWPGNVRELQHVVEYMMNFISEQSDKLSVDQLPAYLQSLNYQIFSEEKDIFNIRDSFENIMNYMEKRVLETALKRNHWNITQTAKELEISRETLHYHIRKLKLKKNKDDSPYFK